MGAGPWGASKLSRVLLEGSVPCHGSLCPALPPSRTGASHKQPEKATSEGMSHLLCPFCSLQLWGVLPHRGRGGLGRGTRGGPYCRGSGRPGQPRGFRTAHLLAGRARRTPERGGHFQSLVHLATSRPNSSAVMPPATSQDRAGTVGDRDE